MKLSDIQIIINKRETYRRLAKDLSQAQSIGAHASIVTGSSGTLYLNEDRAAAAREALVAVVKKEMEPVKAELMVLGVTEFDE